MKKYLIALMLIVSTSVAHSQTEWSLERCIQYALDNNIQIKTQELNSEINTNNLTQSKLGILPSLNAGAGENFTFGRTVDPYTNQFSTDNFSSTNVQLSTSVTLFSGLQQFNSIKKAEIDERAGFLLLEQTKNNIMLAIATAYLNVLYSMDLLEVSENQLSITAQQLERTNKLVASGSLPLQNKYELEAQLANEELSVINNENQLDLAMLSLAQLLEIENIEGFAISRPDLDKINTESGLIAMDQIFEEALIQMPEIEYAELNYQSSEKNLSIAKGAFLPRLTLSASYGTGYSSAAKTIDDVTIGNPYLSGFATDNLGTILDVYDYGFDYTYKTRPFNDQFKDNASTALSFNLSIPIFNGYQTKTNVGNSKLYLEQTKLQVEQARKDLLKEIQQAYSDAQSAMKQYFATEKALESMELSFNYTQKRFDEGLLNTTDYNVAKNGLSQTEAELIRAKYDYIFKLKILDFYRGINIRL